MSKTNIYEVYKNLLKKIHLGEIPSNGAVAQLIDILHDNDAKIRPANHQLMAINYFVSDLTNFLLNRDKPLAVGIVYRKPNGIKTQDFFVIYPNGIFQKFYKGKEKKVFLWLKGLHKKYFHIKVIEKLKP